MTYSPRSYQARDIASVNEKWRFTRRLLGVYATGGGKTDTGLWSIQRLVARYNYRVLVLVHTRDLVDQWLDRIYRAHRWAAPAGVIQADRNQVRGNVVIATMQSLSRPGRLEDLWRFGGIDIVIIDEAHRVLSPTYRALIRTIEERNPQVRLLGLTATPNRTDGQGLFQMFDEVAFNVGINELVSGGYLVPSYQTDLKVDTSIGDVKWRAGDYEVGAVSRVLNKPRINQAVFEKWQAVAGDRPTVIFTSTVAHARAMAELWQRNGVTAAYVSGMTTESEERIWDAGGIQSAFNKGKVQVVANAQVWTEGIDIPSCSCIVWDKATTSRLVFQQGVGRGMRLYPDKRDNLIIRVVPSGAHHGLAGLAHIGHAHNPLGISPVTESDEPFRDVYDQEYRTKFERLFGDELAWRPTHPDHVGRQ